MATSEPTNNSTTQGTELNDVDVLYDQFNCSVSGVPAAPTLPQESPQQGSSFANSGNSASFLGNFENFAAGSIATNVETDVFNVYPYFGNAASGNSHFPVLENLGGTYENRDQSRYHGNSISANVCNIPMPGGDPPLGDYWNHPVNANIFSTSLEDIATQNGGRSGFGSHQINQQGHLAIDRDGGDTNFPMLQSDFHFCGNWRD